MSVGDAVSTSIHGTAIELVDVKRYKMTVAFGESDINAVRAGQAATVTVSAADSEELAAKVLSVDLLSASLVLERVVGRDRRRARSATR